VDLVTFVTVTRSRGQALDAVTQLAAALGVAGAARIREHVIEVPPLKISSTEIRACVQRGESVADLVPRPVAELIAAAGLYRAHS
jgi:nicotinic acid mononucleotide adenylyltransferase